MMKTGKITGLILAAGAGSLLLGAAVAQAEEGQKGPRQDRDRF
ncbi:hypothetical protein [Parvularcula sp. IMCC14364]|nr:hypothetical protein [Parvularcula sp. IMCC14364]